MKLKLLILGFLLTAVCCHSHAAGLVKPLFDSEHWFEGGIIYGERELSFKSDNIGTWELMTIAKVKDESSEDLEGGSADPQYVEQWVIAHASNNSSEFTFNLTDLFNVPNRILYLDDEETYKFNKVRLKFTDKRSGEIDFFDFSWCYLPTKPKINNVTFTDIWPRYYDEEVNGEKELVWFECNLNFEIQCWNLTELWGMSAMVLDHHYEDWIYQNCTTNDCIEHIGLINVSYIFPSINKDYTKDGREDLLLAELHREVTGALMWLISYGKYGRGFESDAIIIDDWITDPQLKYELFKAYYELGDIPNPPEPPTTVGVDEMAVGDTISYQDSAIGLQSAVTPLSLHNSMGVEFPIDYQAGKIYTESLPNGVYILRYKTFDNKIKTFKFFKK